MRDEEGFLRGGWRVGGGKPCLCSLVPHTSLRASSTPPPLPSLYAPSVGSMSGRWVGGGLCVSLAEKASKSALPTDTTAAESCNGSDDLEISRFSKAKQKPVITVPATICYWFDSFYLLHFLLLITCVNHARCPFSSSSSSSSPPPAVASSASLRARFRDASSASRR